MFDLHQFFIIKVKSKQVRYNVLRHSSHDYNIFNYPIAQISLLIMKHL